MTVAALIVPKNLGYAEIAGIPVQNGLYAAAAGAILYAIFGTCRQISMGPSSGLAAVAASAVFAAGITDRQEVASFVAGITLASGAVFLLLAVFKLGWIAQFLSRAVVTGFLFGAALDVVIGELPKITGTKVTGSNSLRSCSCGLAPSVTHTG
jgi:MFS superfamily sulfate permease-like transporter